MAKAYAREKRVCSHGHPPYNDHHLCFSLHPARRARRPSRHIRILSSSCSTMDRPHNPYASESTNTSRVSSPLNPSAPPRSEAQRPRPQSTSTPLKASPAIAACPLVETESTFMQRTRSRSTVVFDESIWKKALGSPSTASEHWWGSESRMHPWRDTTKKHTTIPAEQREGWDNVKKVRFLYRRVTPD